MNARGIGIKPNLVEAFNLYQKAAALKVPGLPKMPCWYTNP